MNFKLLKNNDLILKGNIDFGLSNLVVNSLSKNNLFLNENDFEIWLENRAKKICENKNDEELLSILNLDYNKFSFGRIKEEACCLCALLSNFNLNDGYYLYPVENEIFSLSGIDSRFYRIYMLKNM